MDTYCIDKDSIHLSGISNGGMFSYFAGNHYKNDHFIDECLIVKLFMMAGELNSRSCFGTLYTMNFEGQIH